MPDEIEGFPTIKLFPAGAKDKPITYSGSRTVEDLANFVKESGKYGVDALEAAGADEEEELPDADGIGSAAPAASKKADKAKAAVKDKVKSAASEATEAVKTAVADTDSDGSDHDEL